MVFLTIRNKELQFDKIKPQKVCKIICGFKGESFG